MIIEQHESYRTGDINFFAACMSIGIPPAPAPAEVMAQDDGRTYFQFKLSSLSECGQHRTQEMNRAWGNARAFNAEYPSHPFAVLMNFIGMSIGAKSKEEWIEKGAEFLGISRDAMRKGIKEMDRLEVEAPDSPLSYVAAFILNRFAAVAWVKAATPKEVINQGPSILWMDGHLSKSNKKFLLSHL